MLLETIATSGLRCLDATFPQPLPAGAQRCTEQSSDLTNIIYTLRIQLLSEDSHYHDEGVIGPPHRQWGWIPRDILQCEFQDPKM